jgi:tyrosine-protein kinase Etk/Wzc
MASPFSFDPLSIINQRKQGGLSIKDRIFQYLAFFPLLIASLLISFTIGYLYLRYTPKQYASSATVWVKEPETNSSSQDMLKGLFGTPTVNLENEMQLLRSTPVCRRVAIATGSNVHYNVLESLKPTEFYHTELAVYLKFIAVTDSSSSLYLEMSYLPDEKKFVLTQGGQSYKAGIGDTITTGTYSAVLVRNPSVGFDMSFKLGITWFPLDQESAMIRNSISIAKTDGRSTILRLSTTSINSKRNEALLNGLIQEYKLQNIEDKNKITQSTVNFINERLGIVASELSDVEGNLKEFKSSNVIVDPTAQGESYITTATENQKAIADLEVKLQLATMLSNYVNDRSTQDKLIPSNLGVEDPVLAQLIQGYNELQLKKEKEIRNGIPARSPLIEDYNNQIGLIRSSISENLRNTQKMLTTQRNALSSRQREVKGQMSSVPALEQRMQEIMRQKGIKESLYIFLLQKREESVITMASTQSNYFKVEPPSSAPAGPFNNRVWLICFGISLIIPIALVYLRETLNDQVTTRDDISNILSAPIVGEIGNYSGAKPDIVEPESRSVVAEQFRIIRSNVKFLAQGKEKLTILITSTISGEGKSFASANIAAVLATSGKKTALLEFDLRKPRIIANLNLRRDAKGKGITNYLIGQCEAQDVPLQHPDPNFSNLYILPAGPVPPNPSELILSPRLKDLMEYLKANFDIIIVDSAPVGLVGDSFALAEYCDLTLFMVRQRYSHKRQLAFIEELNKNKKLPNLGVLVNDVKSGLVYGYYSYGYGYGHGSGYGAGYGYGYGRRSKEQGGYFEDANPPGFFKRMWLTIGETFKVINPFSKDS